MSEKIKSLLIRLLFRLLDSYGDPIAEDDKAIRNWLAWSAGDIGFIRYCQWRERQLVKAMLVHGLMPSPRESFVRESGQRFELHNLKRLAGEMQKTADLKKKKLDEEAKTAD